MKCREFKYFLLGCENPDQPPADVKAHLASCADCQDWQNRLALIEMNVPFLPVPESVARADLLRRILSQPAGVKTTRTEAIGERELRIEDRGSKIEGCDTTPVANALGSDAASRSTLGPRERPVSTRRGIGVLAFFRALEPSAKRFAAGSVAAAILLVVFGWLVIRTPHRPVASIDQFAGRNGDPLVATILQCDLRLAEAENAVDRFRALADLADDFSHEVKNLAPVPEAKQVLDDMVMKYEKVVNAGLLELAKDLPGGERNKLLNEVGDRLHKTGREVEELGDKISPRIPKASRETLRRLTQIAYDGDKKLRDLREVSRTRPGDGGAVVVQREAP